MITVEIRQPVRLRDWTVLTTVHVDDAGEVTITGDRAMDFGDLSVHVGGGQFTTLAENPKQWARHLHTAFRTGQLQAVVVEDTEETPICPA